LIFQSIITPKLHFKINTTNFNDSIFKLCFLEHFVCFRIVSYVVVANERYIDKIKDAYDF